TIWSIRQLEVAPPNQVGVDDPTALQQEIARLDQQRTEIGATLFRVQENYRDGGTNGELLDIVERVNTFQGTLPTSSDGLADVIMNPDGSLSAPGEDNLEPTEDLGVRDRRVREYRRRYWAHF